MEGACHAKWLPESLSYKVAVFYSCDGFNEMSSNSIHHVAVLIIRAQWLIERQISQVPGYRLCIIRVRSLLAIDRIVVAWIASAVAQDVLDSDMGGQIWILENKVVR